MGFIGKLNSLVKTGLEVNKLANTVKNSGILNGVDFNNLSPEGIKSIGSKISSNLQSQQSSILSGLSGISFDSSSIEDIAKSITPQDLGIEIPDFQSEMDKAMTDMNSQMNAQSFDVDTSGFDVDMSEFNSAMNSYSFDTSEFQIPDMPDFSNFNFNF